MKEYMTNNELIDYLRTNKKSKSLTTLEESYYSNKLCFLAEKSRIEKGKVLELKGGIIDEK